MTKYFEKVLRKDFTIEENDKNGFFKGLVT